MNDLILLAVVCSLLCLSLPSNEMKQLDVFIEYPILSFQASFTLHSLDS